MESAAEGNGRRRTVTQRVMTTLSSCARHLVTQFWWSALLQQVPQNWQLLTPPEKICRSKSTNQEGVRSAHRTDLCFSINRFSQVVFIPQAQPHAQSLFLFPIVFGIKKGQCHDIQWFFALFLREQKNGGCSRKCHGHRSESLAVRAAWQPGHLLDSGFFFSTQVVY